MNQTVGLMERIKQIVVACVGCFIKFMDALPLNGKDRILSCFKQGNQYPLVFELTLGLDHVLLIPKICVERPSIMT